MAVLARGDHLARSGPTPALVVFFWCSFSFSLLVVDSLTLSSTEANAANASVEDAGAPGLREKQALEAEAAESELPICAAEASPQQLANEDALRADLEPKEKAVPDFSRTVAATFRSRLSAIVSESSSANKDTVLFTIAKFATEDEEPADFSPAAIDEIRHWLCRAKSVGMPPTMVVCIYKDFAKALRAALPEQDRHMVVYLPVRAYIDSRFVDPNCLKLMVARRILQSKKQALYSDLDTLWQREPSDFLGSISSDLAIGQEQKLQAQPETCIKLPSLADLKRDEDGLNWHEAEGTISTGLMFFRSTDPAKAALDSGLMQCQRREGQHQIADWLDSDQTSLTVTLQRLCGSAGLRCSFLPTSFSKSSWGESPTTPRVVHFDAFDDKPLARYLNVQQAEGDQVCPGELASLKETLHISPEDTCGGRSLARASKHAWNIMTNENCQSLEDDSCYDSTDALFMCGCDESAGLHEHHKYWCQRLRSTFETASLVKVPMNGKAWRNILARASACVVPEKLAERLPPGASCEHALPARSAWGTEKTAAKAAASLNEQEEEVGDGDNDNDGGSDGIADTPVQQQQQQQETPTSGGESEAGGEVEVTGPSGHEEGFSEGGTEGDHQQEEGQHQHQHQQQQQQQQQEEEEEEEEEDKNLDFHPPGHKDGLQRDSRPTMRREQRQTMPVTSE